jgi:endonuclease YncB( thermonuclease family)
MMSYEGFPWMSWGGTRQHQSAFRFTFRAALELHEVGWAEYPLVEFGVRGPKDLPYLMSMTGMDLTSSIMLLMDVTIIESLRIQAAAKQADEFGQPEGGLEPDAGPAGLPASSSSSINYFPPDTSLPMHVHTNSFDHGEADGSGIAVSADINEVALVEPDAYLIELQRMASEAKNEALQKVRDGIARAPDGEIKDCLADALRHLEGEVRGFSALLAARALRAVSRALSRCSVSEQSLRAVIKDAEKRLHDHLIYETQLQIPHSNDRALFIHYLEQALEVNSGSLEQKCVPVRSRDTAMERSYARLMNAYGKVICDRFPARGFLSKAKNTAFKRGPRPKRTSRRGNDMATVPEDETLSETSTAAMPTPTDSDVPKMPFQTYSYTMSDAGSSVFVGPAPGLQLSSRNAGSEVDSQSQISFSGGVKVEQRRNECNAAIAVKTGGRAPRIVHPSGARTECSNSLPDARSDTCECVAAPEDLEGHTVDSGMLIISELNRTLVWRDFHGQYHSSHPESQEPLKMSNGHYLFTRPGADLLVASLLHNPKCSLVIAAGMGYWQCLPCARTLLEKAIPGIWVVDEVFGGQWESTGGKKYVITGAAVTSKAVPNPETTPGDVELGSCTSWDLKFNDDRSAACVRDGDTWQCELTPDGYLQWSSAEGILDIWTRASRIQPLSFVRRDKRVDESHQDRVYIFDREFFIEAIMDVDGDTKYRKELDKVWSELREFKLGSFDETNTIVIDASNDDVSHPHNVLRVPQWNTSCEKGEMGVLQNYIGNILTQQPQSIIDHIHEKPIDFDMLML